jgi:hypothetical protein
MPLSNFNRRSIRAMMEWAALKNRAQDHPVYAGFPNEKLQESSGSRNIAGVPRRILRPNRVFGLTLPL